MRPFPDDFMWGATLRGHAVEGQNFASDWWRWEQRPGRIAGNATSKEAADHFTRYAADIRLAADFGLNALLIGFEWSRIEPEPGTFDEESLAHYRAVIATARQHGVEPMIVLQHATLPRWFAAAGGWEHRKSPERFAAYVERVLDALDDLPQRWIPIAEPMHCISRGYLDRAWPPERLRRDAFRLRGARRLNAGVRALLNIGRAHAAAYKAIHSRHAGANVGTLIRTRGFHPALDESAWDVRTAQRENYRCNRLWLTGLAQGKWPLRLTADKSTRGTLDFIACAYFGEERVRFAWNRLTRLFMAPVDAQGRTLEDWAPAPSREGLRARLKDAASFGLPLFAVSGAAEGEDAEACGALLDTVHTLRQLIEEGVDIRGYFVHALLDGFEWDRGYEDRYGLFHIDRTSFSRTPRNTAFIYKELAETGAIRPGTVSRFCRGWAGNSAR